MTSLFSDDSSRNAAGTVRLSQPTLNHLPELLHQFVGGDDGAGRPGRAGRAGWTSSRRHRQQAPALATLLLLAASARAPRRLFRVAHERPPSVGRRRQRGALRHTDRGLLESRSP